MSFQDYAERKGANEDTDTMALFEMARDYYWFIHPERVQDSQAWTHDCDDVAWDLAEAFDA